MAGTTIRNGEVVDASNVTILEHVKHLVNLATFFVTSIFSTKTVREQVDAFNNSRTRTFGGSSNINAGGGGGGASAGGGDAASATRSRYQSSGRSNINTFGPAAQAGCSGGS